MIALVVFAVLCLVAVLVLGFGEWWLRREGERTGLWQEGEVVVVRGDGGPS